MKTAESSLHWNVEPASLDANENCALVDRRRPAGPEVIVVWGVM